MDMGDEVIFEPGDDEFKRDYVELADTEEFKGLSDPETKLCWYVGCVSSPFEKLDYSDRLKKALQLLEFDDKVAADYLKGKMPEKVTAGIEKMKSYKPQARVAGRLALEESFKNIIAVMAVSKAELLGMKMDDRKKYVELAAKATEALPGLIEKMEAGFGVRTKIEKEKKSGKRSSLADDVVNNL